MKIDLEAHVFSRVTSKNSLFKGGGGLKKIIKTFKISINDDYWLDVKLESIQIFKIILRSGTLMVQSDCFNFKKMISFLNNMKLRELSFFKNRIKFFSPRLYDEEKIVEEYLWNRTRCTLDYWKFHLSNFIWR